MTYSSSGRRYYRLDDNYPVVPSGSGLYGALSGAGYLAAGLMGAVSAIWLSSWLG